MYPLAKSALSKLLDLIYPPFCLHCQEPLKKECHILCLNCSSYLLQVDPLTRCPYCFSDEFNPLKDSCCYSCKKMYRPIDRMASVFDYEGPASTLVKRMKYGGLHYLAKGLGGYMAAQFLSLNWPLPDYIIPMPIPRLRMLERGFNQSKLLADAIGSILNCPVVDILKRRSGDFSQAGLGITERLELKSDAFQLKRPFDLHDKIVLLVDDVITTGQSLRCCAEVLREECPKSIYALAACRAL